jgi:predicted outer membrane protein
LIQKTLRETAALDQLLTPVISQMRAELELPFDEAYYSKIIAENHKKQQEYLEAFIQEQAIQVEEE